MNTQYGNQTLDEEDRLAYDFSQQSYKKVGERGNVGEWELDNDLSNVDTGVWHNKSTQQTHVSNRGSTSGYDWVVSDAQIATGTESSGSRFKRAVDTTSKAHQKYGYSVSTSGHSLGGRVSAYTTEVLGDNDWYEKGTGYNPGNSSIANQFSKARSACKGKNPPAFCAKQTSIKERGDYVSQRNFACDVATFGFGGSVCAKSDPFGKTKTYDHRKKRRWVNALTTSLVPSLRHFNNGKAHSLSVFG
jgi:hypothetical protein